MSWSKQLRKIGKNIDRFVGGRGKVGRFNIWSYPERLGLRKLRHKIGWSRGSWKSTGNNSAVSSFASNAGYLGSTGFRRMV